MRASICNFTKQYILNWPLPIGAFQGQWNTTKRRNRTTTSVKNPNWPEASQLAIYKCRWEVEPLTTRIKINEWSERVLNPGSPDLKAGALTTGSHCLFIIGRRHHHYHHILFVFYYLTWVSRPQVTVTKARFCFAFHNSTKSRLSAARVVVTFFARQTRIWCSSTRPIRAAVVSGASHTVVTGQSVIVRPGHLVGALTILFIRIIIRQCRLILSKNNFRLQGHPSICIFIIDRRCHHCHHFLFILYYLAMNFNIKKNIF